MCKGDKRTEHLKTEQRSRSQGAGKDRLGARCVSFVFSPLHLNPLSTPWQCPYSDMFYINLEVITFMTMYYVEVGV